MIAATGFDMFCKAEVCSNFIDSVPMLQVARNNANVEMALSILGGRPGMWEELFIKKRGLLLDGLVGLVKAIAAYMVFAGVELEIERQSFKLTELLQAQKETTAKLQVDLQEVTARANVPLRGLQNKPQWISLSLLPFSALLWGRHFGEHEFVSTYSQKGKITEGDLDRLVPALDVDAADSAASELCEMDEADVNRVKSFVTGIWAGTTTRLAAYRGRHGLTKKESQGVGSSSQDYQPGPGDGPPAISEGVTGGGRGRRGEASPSPRGQVLCARR